MAKSKMTWAKGFLLPEEKPFGRLRAMGPDSSQGSPQSNASRSPINGLSAGGISMTCICTGRTHFRSVA